jgi:pilus assembly protein CpaB
MEPKKIALLAGALVIAVSTALLARSMLSGSPAPEVGASAMPDPQTMPHVLVATKSLPIGTIIGPDAYRYQPWPKDLVEEAYFIQGKAEEAKLVGSVVRTAVAAGQPVTQGSLIQPGDRGFLAAALAPGMRAVTVPVSIQSSVAGFIFPGDRVDLLLTQSVDGGGDGAPLKVAETVLRNLRVLATDQRTDAVDPATGKPVVQTYSNVTLEVTPRMAEKITVAQTVGALSMSLRALTDNNQELEQALASGEIDAPQSNDPNAEKTMMATLASRPLDKGSFVTGADVSRYQRRSVPGKPVESGGTAAPGGVVGPSGNGPIVRVARGAQVEAVALGGK